MRTGALFVQPAFGLRPGSSLGSRPLPLRREGLPILGQITSSTQGFTPPPPGTECTADQFWDGEKCAQRPAAVETPSGRHPAACRNSAGSWDLYDTDSKQFIQTVQNAIVQGQDFPNAPSSIASPGFCSEAEALRNAPQETTATETPQAPAPKPDMVPISIDIQAFTPGGMGPIPVQNYGGALPPKAPPPQEAPRVQASAPQPPKKTAGSELANVGIAAGLVAAGAFVLSTLK